VKSAKDLGVERAASDDAGTVHSRPDFFPFGKLRAVGLLHGVPLRMPRGGRFF
jgi:hypothetical protein